jgi:aminopeptidase I
MLENPTVFHAVDAFSKRLASSGFQRLDERDLWTGKIKPGGKYCITRDGSALLAFSVGKAYKPGNGIGLVAGHVDALTVKLKPIAKLQTKGGYVQMGVAPYAGALSDSWWDRDLGIGGRVLIRDLEAKKIKQKLVKLNRPIARIPSLAPHFGTISAGPFNKETQMVPIIALDDLDLFGAKQPPRDSRIQAGSFAATQPDYLVQAIAGEMSIDDYSSIINWDLELFDIQPAQIGGIKEDFIFAGRLDDKLCCYAAVEALLATSEDASPGIMKMVGCFNDEEIGSQLRQGAQSNFLSSIIDRVCEALLYHNNAEATNRGIAAGPQFGPNLINQTIANSFLVSSDVTHAFNPNFPNAYLENHSPRLNVGVAVSADPNGHMTTDCVSSALLQRIAEECGSTLQVFQVRNDVRSGSTIGPMTSSRLGMRAIDAGIPQLSMHSIRATTGRLDPGLGVKLYKGFFDYYEDVDAEFR